MKRDWNLIRDLLEAIEQNKVKMHWESLKSDEDRRLALLHYDLLQESGLIVNYVLDSSDFDDSGRVNYHPAYLPEAPNVPFMHLSMAGYDMLEALRDKNVWTSVRNKAANAGVALTWEFIKQAIPVIYKAML